MFARLHADRRGAIAVEFAFIAPLFFAMLFGVFQFGLAQHRLSSVRDALEGATRALVINPDLNEDAVKGLVMESMEASLTSGDVAVTLTKESTANGEIAHLSATYVAQFGVPGMATFNIPYEVANTAFLRKLP